MLYIAPEMNALGLSYLTFDYLYGKYISNVW